MFLHTYMDGLDRVDEMESAGEMELACHVSFSRLRFIWCKNKKSNFFLDGMNSKKMIPWNKTQLNIEGIY